ncbi:cell division septation protein DedD [Paenibacillus endophyticus]|uniref:Cell division septation protein DedD n=1 Tax=Paenibacillus endophyticus TaxID=1294268 RepID=A0A7W5C9E6_9BACL|nr:S-layer homology domain-containing protein [Paenibacillus endophyticus]MBB3153527.1 cell division septation protein DedD [Paenibacillus endophyticus]
MKKTWIIMSLVALLSSSVLVFSQDPAQAKTTADFNDLKDLDAATKAKFDAMISAGIFDGVAEGKFGLKEEMNRAQFAKVAALIYNLDVNKDLKTSSFTDVKSDDPANGYALPYIEALKKSGITDGSGEGTYNPAGQVSKEQLATFLVRGLGKREEAESKPGVTDNTVSDWAKGYVELALQLKLLNNNVDGKFGGSNNATRDLLVTGAYEAKEQFVASSKPSPTPTATPVSTPVPTQAPTQAPTSTPTSSPTSTPTSTPTSSPTSTPSSAPTSTPAVAPIDYSLKVGTHLNTVAITYVHNQDNSLRIARSANPIAAPLVGTNVSTIAALHEYTAGSDITDITFTHFLGLYEVNSDDVIVKFSSIYLEEPKQLTTTSLINFTKHETLPSGVLDLVSLPNPELPDAVRWEVKSGNDLTSGTPPVDAIFGGEAVESETYYAHPNFIALAAVDSEGRVVGYTFLSTSTLNVEVPVETNPPINLPTNPPIQPCPIFPMCGPNNPTFPLAP